MSHLVARRIIGEWKGFLRICKRCYEGLPSDYVRAELDLRNFVEKIHGDREGRGLGNDSRRRDEGDIHVAMPAEVFHVEPDSAAKGAGNGRDSAPKVHAPGGFGCGSIFDIGGEPVDEIAAH